MKISVANTKKQLINTLQIMMNDWQKNGVMQSLIYYCNNSTEFPYSQLRKMEKMGLLRSLSMSKRNKTYEWRGPENPNLENIAQNIINFTGKNIENTSKMQRLSTMGLDDDQKSKAIFGFLKPESKILQEKEQKQKSEQDITKLTVKIALILQKHEVPEDKIEPITSQILGLLG